ncbi:MAG: polyphosphate kinase 1 [Spirochaetales bacterium]
MNTETSSRYSRDPELRPEHNSKYFNRELSWIEFNARVLDQMLDPDVPLLERLNFMTIVANNFDEFFMVRVAGLKRQVRGNNYTTCPTGMSPREQLREISRRVHELTDLKYKCLHEELLPALADIGIVVHFPKTWNQEQRAYLSRRFREEYLPVLTPIRCRADEPLPYAGNMRLSAAFVLTPRSGGPLITQEEDDEGDGSSRPPLYIAVVPIPPSLPRLIYLPASDGKTHVALVEHAIVEYAEALFPGYTVSESLLFRVTRDADFGVDEERDEDFVEAMEQVLEGRKYSQPVRLSVSGDSKRLKEFLTETLDIHQEEVYEKPQPLELKEFGTLLELRGYEPYRWERWIPREHPSFPEDEGVFDCLRAGDSLLYHPYDSFSPVIRLVQEAADDPEVLAIKMILYRTSGRSPVIRALRRAAENGKQVVALVELKARFDEEQNIEWAEQLERSGVIVVYGVARLKVHAKALLIVRRERGGVRRYIHLGTGNYNEKTALLYSDLGLLTTNEELAWEVGQFFNALTGYSVVPNFGRLAMAPAGLKSRLLQLIQREASRAESEGSGRIVAKMNSLSDIDIVDALYEASNAGVEIDLNVRGICMLVPGVPGQSENIRVVSIVGRYLEHARAFYFENGGNPELYLSSADWMPRNLERRVELLFPVDEPPLRDYLYRILLLHMADTEQAFELTSSGRYVRRSAGADGPINSQAILASQARAAAEKNTSAVESELPVRRKPPKPRLKE